MHMAKDFTSHMNREVFKVVSCKKDDDPLVEELSIAYLNKARRLQLQAESIRDIIAGPFQMKPYPASLNKSALAVWGNATVCVIAKKSDGGGYQSLLDVEILAVVEDLRQHNTLFFR